MTDTTRKAELKQMLADRRRELQNDLDTRLREGRHGQANEVRDLGEDSVAEHEGDLERSLLQMRAETLNRIDEALARLAADKYGTCTVCDHEISAPRLRALPFAVRCKRCEDRREQTHDTARQVARNGGSFALVPDSVSA